MSIQPNLSAADGTPHGAVLLVANQHDRTISVVDAAAAKQIATIPDGAVTGHEVAVSPDGRTAYVPIYGNSGVGKPGTDGDHMVIMDIAERKVIGNVDFGKGVRPHQPVINPSNGLLYVTTELNHSITIIDPKTYQILGSVPTDQAESHMLAISHDGKRGYTANVGPGTVSVLDLEARKTLIVIPISQTTQRISITPDDSMVFTADQTKPQLAVIDTATNTVKTWVPLPAPGYGTASTHNGRWLLVAVPKASSVAVIDLSTLKVVRTIDVPKAPQEIVVRPDDQVAYVSCNQTGTVAELDLSSWKVLTVINAGAGADGLAWASPGLGIQSLTRR
jgi:YVTN family beta-propeller protein